MCICLYLILLLKHDIILFNAIHAVSVATIITFWFIGSYVMTYEFCGVTFVKKCLALRAILMTILGLW